MRSFSRKEPICTKTGFVLYTKDGIDWKICYPDGDKRYGRGTPERLALFILALSKGMTIDKADELAYHIDTEDVNDRIKKFL